METSSRKKRSLLINPKFQWTLIGYAGFLAVLILLTMTALFEYGFRQFVLIGKNAGLPEDHIYFQFIQMQIGSFHNVMIALGIVVAFLLLVGGLAISHKIAGPIYRMQKSFKEMADSPHNGLKEIHFRKNDFFPELADSFNHLVHERKKQG